MMEKEEDASPEECVALCDFTGSDSEQVRAASASRLSIPEPWITFPLSPCSWVSPQETDCSSSISLQQTGGGRSCGGSRVMLRPATCAREPPMRKRMLLLWKTRGRMKNTMEATGHWLDMWTRFAVDFYTQIDLLSKRL